MRIRKLFLSLPSFGSRRKKHGRLVRQYFLIFTILLSGGLITAGLLELYFRFLEIREDVSLLQGEAAKAVASSIARYILEIEGEMKEVALSQQLTRREFSPENQFELMKLLKTVPAITEVIALDERGVPKAHVARFRTVFSDEEPNYSRSPSFSQASQGVTFFGPVHFVNDTDPYMTIAVPRERYPGSVIGVLQCEVNLRHIWEIIRDTSTGKNGYAYIVSRSGHIIAHPDISLVLQKRRANHLRQVQAALRPAPAIEEPKTIVSENLDGEKVLSAFGYLPSLDWAVIFERPLDDAYQPLYGSLARTSSLLLVGLGVSLFASLMVARRVVHPLQTLRLGVERISKGDLNYHLELKTGDEIEVLADEFNKMTGALQEAYGGLEKKVAERTQELRETLERQTAIAEMLRAMSSLTNLQALWDTMTANAVRLAHAKGGVIRLRDTTGVLRFVSYYRDEGSKLFEVENISVRADEESATTWAVRGRKPVQLHDIWNERQNFRSPIGKTSVRTVLAVPILRQDLAIGAIVIFRDTVEPFTDREIDLMTTFADQAVIAMENVRLFEELQTRTSDLARSVEELQALGSVSQAVSSTLDLPTVLSTIVLHAVKLSGADAAGLCEFHEATGRFSFQVNYCLSDELIQAVEQSRVPLGESVLGRAVASRAPLQVADIYDEPNYPLRTIVDRMGLRAILGVPLIREGTVIGALLVGRKMPGLFPEQTVDLLQTFATQSVVAIQNARLFRNIEEQRSQLESANQRLQELDRLKSAFVSNVSHELRTPLTAIESLIDNMLDGLTGRLNEKQIRYISGVKESTDRLARLIEDLLDLSVIEAGRIELKPASFSVSNLIHQVAESLRPVAQDKLIALELPSANGNLMAWADRDKITQVLTNLIANAINFTPPNGKVELSVESVNGGEWLRMNVADTGPGIPRDEAEKIFDEFYQVGHPGRVKTKGVGLGLAISKKLIEMHGGTIGVKSVVGEGSTFFFTVPAR